MYKDDLVHELISLAKTYAAASNNVATIHPLEGTKSSIIFNKVEHSFNALAWEAIKLNNDWKARTEKAHDNAKTKGICEMQSSNSSDALAMNIFCHPKFTEWGGTKKLFVVDEFFSIEFGFNPLVSKNGVGDKTEVDVYINKSIICECKLTEEGFTQKAKHAVELYDAFKDVFLTQHLIQNENYYSNYQLIRNILAAHQHNNRFLLICDMRRPDLARSFYQTIRCIKDELIDLRTNCEIIYWQDIAMVCGNKLKQFLKEKYGI